MPPEKIPEWLIGPIKSALKGWMFVSGSRGRFVLTEHGAAGFDLVRTFSDPHRTHIGFVVHSWAISARLAQTFGPHDVDLPEAIGPDECHWFRDAVFIADGVAFKPGRWEVRADDSASIVSAVADVVRVADEVRVRSSDEGLANLWLTERDPWLSEARQAAFVAVLLHAAGRDDESRRFARRVRTIAAAGDREASRLLAALDRPESH